MSDPSSPTPLELPSIDKLGAEIENLEARLKVLKRILKAVSEQEPLGTSEPAKSK